MSGIMIADKEQAEEVIENNNLLSDKEGWYMEGQITVFLINPDVIDLMENQLIRIRIILRLHQSMNSRSC